ncbi:hypothetical protein A2412_04845 [Candidatus Peribacteria bacterium RIFOXYC1_FULL_58_8]|nr:MAG: hypothetical protein A2412_04845 [Candidatus Peribacteria bacterium RIFOXYC1_FULL_58_8]
MTPLPQMGRTEEAELAALETDEDDMIVSEDDCASDEDAEETEEDDRTEDRELIEDEDALEREEDELAGEHVLKTVMN